MGKEHVYVLRPNESVDPYATSVSHENAILAGTLQRVEAIECGNCCQNLYGPYPIEGLTKDTQAAADDVVVDIHVNVDDDDDPLMHNEYKYE